MAGIVVMQGKNKILLEGDNLSVKTIRQKILEETGIPEGAQKLIFRGKTLVDDEETVKSGSKLMLLGGQSMESESMGQIRKIEKGIKEVDDDRRNLVVKFNELSRGFLDQEQTNKGLSALKKKLAYCQENLMKHLEALDAVQCATDIERTHRKAAVIDIQEKLRLCDHVQSDLELAAQDPHGELAHRRGESNL